MIHLLRSRVTPEQLDEMLEQWELTVKLAVDIQRQVLAGGGYAHSDCEDALLNDGSQQEDVWGASWIPLTQEILYESMINYRPRQKVFSAIIQDAMIREQIEVIIRRIFGGL